MVGPCTLDAVTEFQALAPQPAFVFWSIAHAR